MARAVVINGSGRKNGHTAAMCDSASSVLDGFCTVDRFDVCDMDIADCDGCDGCFRKGCVHKDDMRLIMDAVRRCDILILASPLRFDGPSSQIKRAMDRFQEAWNNHWEDMPGQCIVMICAGRHRVDFTAAELIFKRFCKSLGIEKTAFIEICGTDDNDPSVTAAESKKALESVFGADAA
jgi:multimeric flavodoxin WrbA